MKARRGEPNLRPFPLVGLSNLSAQKWGQEESLRHNLDHLESCTGLGANLARTHPRFPGRVGTAGRMSTAVELLRRLGGVAKDFGLIVCLENMSSGWVMTSRDSSPTATATTWALSTTPATG
jgi:sugar phosphate isomerase/epimerase